MLPINLLPLIFVLVQMTCKMGDKDCLLSHGLGFRHFFKMLQ